MTDSHKYSFSFNYYNEICLLIASVLVRKQLHWLHNASRQSYTALEILSLLAWICSEVHVFLQC